MPSFAIRSLLLPASLCVLVVATQAPQAHPEPNNVAECDPLITPSPSLNDVTRTYKRGIISDLTGDVGSILSGLGSDVPSYVASGVPNFFQNFPTGDDVQSSLGLDDSQVAALPTNALNLDPYANYTEQGWNAVSYTHLTLPTKRIV